ncbi:MULTISPECIES: MFS transporter [unclassified Sporosarcina]|uniref:MFS transporter n=1 Tax=unclassified Sporosarcina TaxID=2647733 RepID=UPI00203A9905|nr:MULTISPECIES: MFS transporter [unclassified Sporosarcina]GKV64584.1 MFS transporter [Sporosarcina sp. NCCP-2331]GLB54543.1 MFS transporter [Sporosarcina sp. NCCP-2378]
MKNKSFRFLWLGQSLANLGDVFYIVGIISILYIQTESPFILALVPFINMFGRFISGIISPWLLNRYPLKRLLVYSQTGKTVLLSFLVLFLMTEAKLIVFVILFFVGAIAFLDGWAAPASHAMLPRIVQKEQLVKANSFFSIVSETVNLGGWALGGIFVALAGGKLVILSTLGFYIISTFMMFGILDPVPFHRKATNGKQSGELTEGWKIIWKNPLFRSLHVIIVFEAIANVVWIASILYIFVAEVLNQTEAWWGYINTAFFAGMIIGGIICSRYAARIESNLRQLLILFSFGISMVTLLFGLTAIPWISIIIVILNGVVQQVKSIVSETLLQKSATVEELPKIYAVQSAVISLLFGISSLGFGAVAEMMDIRITFILAAALLAAGAVYAVIRRRDFMITAE